MTKEFLTKLGVSEEMISQILAENKKDCDGVSAKFGDYEDVKSQLFSRAASLCLSTWAPQAAVRAVRRTTAPQGLLWGFPLSRSENSQSKEDGMNKARDEPCLSLI